jgi:protein-S-isoprenylcysteine O-methyltransferase Ste14
MGSTPSLLVLSAAWLGYGLLHSLLASLAVKRWIAAHWPGLMPAYRLIYNLVALLLLMPFAGWLLVDPGPSLWRWTGPWRWLGDGLALGALAALLLPGGSYDTGAFLGWRPWREGRRDGGDGEPFRIGFLHRFVRHPWYALSLVLLWTRDMTALRLVSALWITAYFIVGSRLEERKLIAAHGDRYRRYRARVAGLLPLPWKTLSRSEARELEARPLEE